MEERMHTLERRLAAAERQVRFLLAVLFAAPLITLALLAFKLDARAAQPDAAGKARTVVKAPFDVVGANGDRLMTVEEKKGGGAMVRFYRPQNKVNAQIDYNAAGGSFGLNMPDQKLGVVLDSLSDGGSLSVYAATGKEGVQLRTTSSEGPKFTLADKDGAVLFAKP